MNPNILLIISAIEAGLRAMQELNALLQKAQMENRDVTDEEINTLRASNEGLSKDLIDRLRRV